MTLLVFALFDSDLESSRNLILGFFTGARLADVWRLCHSLKRSMTFITKDDKVAITLRTKTSPVAHSRNSMPSARRQLRAKIPNAEISTNINAVAPSQFCNRSLMTLKIPAPILPPRAEPIPHDSDDGILDKATAPVITATISKNNLLSKGASGLRARIRYPQTIKAITKNHEDNPSV